MNAFITSQFGYCPLIWGIIAGKCIDKLIKLTKELYALFIWDNASSFVDLLKKSGSVSIHDRNLQYLAVEIYKALHNLSSSLMSEIFRIKTSNYNFRNKTALVKNHPVALWLRASNIFQ